MVGRKHVLTFRRYGMTDQHSLFPVALAPMLDDPDERAALVGQWLILMRDVMPGMAAACRWPISNDHCFMRVCLDAVMGVPWHTVVKRPAIRHLTSEQLRAAIAVAEAIVREPATLGAFNRQSIRWRQKHQ